MTRPLTNGPRSLIVTVTLLPFFLLVTRTLVPHGSVRWAFTFLFAAIYKVLPDRKLEWGDVAVGAIVTGVLFTVGT